MTTKPAPELKTARLDKPPHNQNRVAPRRAPRRAISLTVARALVRCLQAEGVRTVFVLPGGPMMPIPEALFLAGGIRVVMAKHEAGAAFLADGYQRVAGGLAVCFTTAGPGAANAVSAVAGANREGIPLLVISGAPGLSSVGRDPAQDSSTFGVDTVALFRPVTKLSVAIVDAERAVELVQTAIRHALAGRPGAVHLSIAADLLKRPVLATIRPATAYRADARPVDLAAVERAADALLSWRRPLILAGPGVRASRATAELRAVAERLGVPVATVPKAKGVLPETDPRSVQVFGFAGSPLADKLVLDDATDGLLVVGTSLGELGSHAWDERLARKRIIQIDVDGTELAKWAPVEVGVVGDARATLAALDRALAARPRRAAWWPPKGGVVRPARGVMTDPARCVAPETLFDDRAPLRPQRVVGELGRVMPPETNWFIDVGGCMALAEHYLVVANPNGFHCNLSYATMGHAVAAVVGGALADPGAPAVCLCGDGAFLMTGVEVHTAVEHGVPCVWVVLNNGGQGSVLMGSRRQFGTSGRRRGLARMATFRRPVDVAGFAEAMGARAFRVTEAAQLGPALREALACGEPAVVDARVDLNEELPFGMRLTLLDRFFNRKA
jgi:acetolactate synthase-1/2/3 large subunit